MASSLKDIAAYAGVSTATVSRVLSGARPVNAKLRERVMAAVENYGYQPNLVARSLRMSKSFVLSVIVPSITDPFFTEFVRAIDEVAYSTGYSVNICSSDGMLDKEQRHLEAVSRRRVDGVFIKVADMHKSNLTPLIQSGIPVVLVDRMLDGAALDTVMVDTRQGAYTAVDYLIQRGYRRIATLAGPQHVSTAIQKLDGYRQALVDNGLTIDASLIAIGDYTESSGRHLGRQLLDLPTPPDAFLVANNQMTYGFFSVVRERGLRIPQQIALIGFDDSDWTSMAIPPITVIDQPAYEVGHVAAQMLLDRLADSDREPQHRILSTRLIVRGSC